MASVFLARCDPGDFERTVASPVAVSEFSDRPEELEDADDVRLWGAEAGSRAETYFEKMEPGDLVLFHGDGEYVGAGRIGTTFADEEGWASEVLWDGTTSTLLFTVESFTSVSVPADAVHGIFDYSEGYTPDSLSRVADGRLDNSLDAIELAVQRYSEQRA